MKDDNTKEQIKKLRELNPADPIKNSHAQAHRMFALNPKEFHDIALELFSSGKLPKS